MQLPKVGMTSKEKAMIFCYAISRFLLLPFTWTVLTYNYGGIHKEHFYTKRNAKRCCKYYQNIKGTMYVVLIHGKVVKGEYGNAETITKL